MNPKASCHQLDKGYDFYHNHKKSDFSHQTQVFDGFAGMRSLIKQIESQNVFLQD